MSNWSLYHVLQFLETTDVSVELPSSLPEDAGSLEENSTKVYITVFANAGLFPFSASQHVDAKLQTGTWSVTSPIVSVSVGEC